MRTVIAASLVGKLGEGGVAAIAADGQRGSAEIWTDDRLRAAFEVMTAPYGNVAGNPLCLVLKSKLIRKIAGSRR